MLFRFVVRSNILYNKLGRVRIKWHQGVKVNLTPNLIPLFSLIQRLKIIIQMINIIKFYVICLTKLSLYNRLSLYHSPSYSVPYSNFPFNLKLKLIWIKHMDDKQKVFQWRCVKIWFVIVIDILLKIITRNWYPAIPFYNTWYSYLWTI
jgi:hypothetical protein